ncbi:MAG: hypothetical protein ACKN92_05690, partial [Candidatus Nanopelagicaceae bacterium]
MAQVTPFEILVAPCAAGAITAVEATSSAASATEVLRNILSSKFGFQYANSALFADFAMAKSYWSLSKNLVTKTSEWPVSYRCFRRNEKPAL